LWTSTAEADVSALAAFPAGLERGVWQRKTCRNKVGVRRGRSAVGVDESWKQRTLSSGGRDIEVQHSFLMDLQILRLAVEYFGFACIGLSGLDNFQIILPSLVYEVNSCTTRDQSAAERANIGSDIQT
jgi:hypothetical protein